MRHQFVERETGTVKTEKLLGDKAIQFLYSTARENAPRFFRVITSARISNDLLAFIKFDAKIGFPSRSSIESFGVNLRECLNPTELTTLRKVFERRIRYWDCRPMSEDASEIVSPADSKVIVGSLNTTSNIFLKEKFFNFEELLGTENKRWFESFQAGDFAVFRLTPEKYHYNHTPVSGLVLDYYEISGDYHSCNPSAVVNLVTPFSKNRRIVTIIDSDVPGGTGVGIVAMVEVVALMIGNIVQAYSEYRYDEPRPVMPGMFLKKGFPKSLYRPGSSTDVVFFQRDRIEFCNDLVNNMRLAGVTSRFSEGFGRPLVETDIKVRSTIGSAKQVQGSI
jgi:phosphatidylserine decarboxylase